MPVNFSAASTPKAPPKRTGRSAASVSIPEAPQSLRELREDGLIGIAQLGQALLLGIRQYADAATVGNHFPPVAKELAVLADRYESLAKPIDLIIQLGPFGALLAAALPLVTQIGVNHRLMPAGTMGTVPPEMLSAQMQTQVLRMQAEAMKAQQEAQAMLNEAQREYNTLVNGAEG